MYTYPNNDAERAQNMLAVMGSFWTRTYSGDGAEQLHDYVIGKGQIEAQTYQDMLEAVASLSRLTVPLFHRDLWYLLTLRESEMNTVATNVRRFDEPGVAFTGSERFDASASRPHYRFTRPGSLVTANLIMNRLTNPSVTLVNNIDYVMPTDEQTLIFRENPFLNALLPSRNILDGDDVIDREIALWVFRGDFDWQHVYTHFGYVLGLQLKSSRGYRDLVNAIFDAIVAGSPAASLDMAFSAITGVPLVQETQETVEELLQTDTEVTIITDRHVYKHGGGALPVVAVGDVVRAGDSLTDALRIDEFHLGDVPANLQALSLGRGFLLDCFFGDLVFENKEVALHVDADHPSGYTYCSFGVGGHPADVEYFFDELHARGIADIREPTCDDTQRHGTLAHLLDQRTNPTGEPLRQHLPTTINPLAFLTANVLRNNAYLVRIKMGALGRHKLGLYNIRHLRRLLPPHTALFIAIELPAQSDTISTDHVSENLTVGRAAEPLSDTVESAEIIERLNIRLVSGTCQ